MVEALATGKAIVSTSVGAAADLIEIGKNGYIVDRREARLFCEAMVQALSLNAREHSLQKARPYALDGLAEDLGKLWPPLRPRPEAPPVPSPTRLHGGCPPESVSLSEGVSLARKCCH
jgi:hypothetical protein